MADLFLRATVAIIWDFDTTLMPGYMQDPLFRRFGIDGNQFWKEANALPQFYRQHGATRASEDTNSIRLRPTHNLRHGKHARMGVR